MRIAVSGTHASGKSTLIAELRKLAPKFHVVEEPYYALLDEGYVFAAEPTPEDFEAQLERSIALVSSAPGDSVLFERCPLDYCAYLAALPGAAPKALSVRMPEIQSAIAQLDLIVYLPLERPDRIDVAADEGRGLRKRMDRHLREILLEDAWGFGAATLEVRGTLAERAHRVLYYLRR